MTAAEALRSGRPVVLPFDTVYGLAAEPHHEESARRLYELKGRPPTHPTALVAADVAALFALLPELDERVAELLPSQLTLVVPNPAQRFPWICGTTPEKIGVRVPVLPEEAAAAVRELGVVVATSANLHGGPDPRRIDDLAPELRGLPHVDAGELPGKPSTVLDCTGPEPVVLRS